MTFPAMSQAVDVNHVDARATRGNYVPGQVIVKFKQTSNVSVLKTKSNRFSTSSVNSVDKVLKEIGVTEITDLMPLTGATSIAGNLRTYSGTTIKPASMQKAFVVKLSDERANIHSAIEKLKALPEVEYAEPNYTVYALGLEDGELPTDPYYQLQYGIEAINLPELWKQPVKMKEGPVIAILDTGVDITHPDLAANIWTNKAEQEGASGYDDDSNGYTDDIHGWDFVNQTGNIADNNGHGTHCAGIAAACGFNGTGIVGANPDAKIMPLTVLQSNGQGDVATIIRALDYAAANGANIISMSLGSYSTSMAFEDALGRAYAKAVIIAAAGNDGYCLNHSHPDKGQLSPMPMFPAAYTFVLGVQASTGNGSLASFSNYDDDGATYSPYPESQLYNYEVTVPGVSIMSTYPGGLYKELNGTSMATPLVAGAVSRLLQAKEYNNKELLFGDLINALTKNKDLDIYGAFAFSDKDRKPELQFVTIDMEDIDGDGDGRPDAGEELAFYPIIRNSWGQASNISFTVESNELGEPVFEILEGKADFGTELSSYGKARAKNPVRIKLKEDVADGRIVMLKFRATGNDGKEIEQDIELTVENVVELTGLLDKDMTLTPNNHYVVSGIFGVPEGLTLTIEPGTVVKFRSNSQLTVNGKINANGEKGHFIKFTMADHETGRVNNLNFGTNDLSYCDFSNIVFTGGNIADIKIFTRGTISKCLFRNLNLSFSLFDSHTKIEKSSLYNNFHSTGYLPTDLFRFSNLVNHLFDSAHYFDISANNFQSSNVFNTVLTSENLIFSLASSGNLTVYKPEEPCYLGTSNLSIAKGNVIDINHPMNSLFGNTSQYDFSNMPDRPYAEAPGIVWKVEVNGFDAQDQFDELPALGVGTHKFDIYFNRKMNTEVNPTVAMGVRPPYTSTAIGENGHWNEAGDVYSVELTITGKSAIDGLNRIYVDGAEDDEYFPIPVEDTRFNVLVQAAGSLSEGFSAVAGLGRVDLTWENDEENYDDLLGFNMYRYELDEEGVSSDTICINRKLIEPKNEMKLTDYDVVPRQTYCYFYKAMRTDMAETSPSRTVAVTPETATQGDANGSGEVNVADVITTVNYASGQNPQPFIFEAADMNFDKEIDILDIVGIIRVILHPEESITGLMADGTAQYTVDENGVVYVDSPVALAGIQLNVILEDGGSVTGTDDLTGFEQTGAWLNNSEYIFLVYNLNGKALSPGRHAIACISNGKIADIRLSDVNGRDIQAEPGTGTTVIDTVNADDIYSGFAKGIYTISGVKISSKAENLDKLPSGIYIVDGKKIMK